MKVLMTRKILPQGIERLRNFTDELIINESSNNMGRPELLEKVRGVDAIASLLSDKIDKEVMEAAGPQLKIIANYAVGYNNIDVDEATKRGIMVTNTPDVLTDATADLAWALIMTLSRRIIEADQYCREGKFTGWSPDLMLGMELSGKTIGILGAGRIGQATGRRARAFGMNIIYCSRHDKFKFEVETKATRVGLEDLLKDADIVSIHLPLVEGTYHLLDEHELGLMKKSAFLINTGRGPIVNEQALVNSLQAGKIAGAGLDVYEAEPDIHWELIKMKNTVLLPHIGSATTETRRKMSEMVADNIIAALSGKKPKNLVNKVK
ncbi:MAG: 2-hydroxyacid dehydrogenase [Fidelibacterota bacterium]